MFTFRIHRGAPLYSLGITFVGGGGVGGWGRRSAWRSCSLAVQMVPVCAVAVCDRGSFWSACPASTRETNLTRQICLHMLTPALFFNFYFFFFFFFFFINFYFLLHFSFVGSIMH